MIRVVIVEDEEHLRNELVLTVPWERLGCLVVGDASDGLEGCAMIERTCPDLVLCDIRMPGLDGVAMIKRVQALLPPEKWPSVVFLSGYDDFSYAQAAVRLGADDYLLKPVDDEELFRVVTGIRNAWESRTRGAKRRRVHTLDDQAATFIARSSINHVSDGGYSSASRM